MKLAAVLFPLLLLPAAALAQREPPPPPSPEKIKADCWMKYDRDRKLTLDQRLALVEKCVAERQAGQPR
jgi:hypothetical protein